MNEVMLCRDCGQSSDILKIKDAGNNDVVDDDCDEDAHRSSYPLLTAINEDISSPACLATVLQKDDVAGVGKTKTTLLNVLSELEMLGSSQARNALINSTKESTDKSEDLSAVSVKPKTDRENNTTIVSAKQSTSHDMDLEIGADVSAGMTASGEDDDVAADISAVISNNADSKAIDLYAEQIRVHGTEELPAVQAQVYATDVPANADKTPNSDAFSACTLPNNEQQTSNDHENRHNSTNGNNSEKSVGSFANLPKIRRSNSVASGATSFGYRRKVPMRTTPDGTNIYYWCDLSKRAQKGWVIVI